MIHTIILPLLLVLDKNIELLTPSGVSIQSSHLPANSGLKCDQFNCGI